MLPLVLLKHPVSDVVRILRQALLGL
jgi:hypothetical protein